MEREQQSLRRRAFEGIFFTSVGNITLKVLSIIATFAILHYLAPYDYGIWRLLLSVLSVCGLLGLSGVTGMLVADISREMGMGHTGIANAIIYRISQYFLVTAIFASGILYIIAPIITNVTGIGLTVYLRILAITLLAAGLRQTYQIVFQSRMQPVKAQVLQNAISIVYLVGIGIFIMYFNLGVLGLVIAYSASIALPVLVYAPWFLRDLRGTFTQDDMSAYSFRKALFGRGRWALAEDYVSTLNNSLWPWVAGATLGIANVGIISIALMMFSQIAALVPIQYVLRSVLPRIVSDTNRLAEWVTRGLRYAFFSHISIALVAFVAATLLFPHLAPQYVGVVPLFAALLLSLPFRVYGIVLTEWFYAHRAQREFFIANVIPMVVMVAPLPFLLMWWSLLGFLIWYTALALLTALFTRAYIERLSGMRVPMFARLFPDEYDARFFTATVGTFMTRCRHWCTGRDSVI